MNTPTRKLYYAILEAQDEKQFVNAWEHYADTVLVSFQQACDWYYSRNIHLIHGRDDVVEAMDKVIFSPCESHIIISYNGPFELTIHGFTPTDDKDNNKKAKRHTRKLKAMKNKLAKSPMRIWK